MNVINSIPSTKTNTGSVVSSVDAIKPTKSTIADEINAVSSKLLMLALKNGLRWFWMTKDIKKIMINKIH
jgi:hypothetical protein